LGSEEVVFVREDAVVDAVEGVFFDEGEVVAEEVADRTLLEPLAVELPFAAGIDEAVGDEGLEDVAPGGAFAALGQALAPEFVESELALEFAGEPVGSPLAGAVEAEILEADADADIGGVGGDLAVPGEEGHLAGLTGGFVETLEDAAPGGFLAVVDFAEVEDGALEDFPADAAAVFHNGPVAVFFAVFETSGAS
jgi:hypothetical protein